MVHKLGIAALCLLLITYSASYSQSVDSVTNKVLNFPLKWFGRIGNKAADLNQRLTRQTQKYLQQMARQEDRFWKELSKTDSAAAARMSAASGKQYAAMLQKFKGDTSAKNVLAYSGSYQPYLDSLATSMSFLKQNPQLISPNQAGITQQASTELQQLQVKMQASGEVNAFVQQRKAMIRQYLSKYTIILSTQGQMSQAKLNQQWQAALNTEYQKFNAGIYYYTQRVQQYKDMLNSPDKMEKEALAVLSQSSAYRDFVRSNSQMATLFSLPGNTSNPSTPKAALTGLQTKDTMQKAVQGKIAPGGAGGMAAFSQYLQSAKSKMSALESNVQNYGAGGENIESPQFKPNDQKAKTFWGRLEYGFNMQTSRTNYEFPTTTDLGLSLGYKLNKTNSLGIGASYKIGWGSGINDIAVTGQGVGLRSFIDIQVKGSWSATGGFEYNYETPSRSFKPLENWSNWTRSGLIGVSKTVSLKSRVLKNTSLQLLWDFLSYYQYPRTQPILFRVGYGF